MKSLTCTKAIMMFFVVVGQKCSFWLLVTMCLHNIFQAEVKVNLAALKQDCESLKAKIVQSPERFKGVSTVQLTWSNVCVPWLTYVYCCTTDFTIDLCFYGQKFLEYCRVALL